MNIRPVVIDDLALRLSRESLATPGHLSDKEARFLAILAACVGGEGVILEIGCLRGRSTAILAKAEAAVRGRAAVVAVDPFLPLERDNPRADVTPSSRAELFANLEREGVAASVEFHQMTSQELAKTWARPIRLLWIDGDHSFEGATSDFVNFAPHVPPGGVVAFHDVMHCEAVSRAFAQRVLRSGEYGHAGIVGSIGWGQRRMSAGPDPERANRERLAMRLERHAAAAASGRSWVQKTYTKLLRSRVPHHELSAAEFQQCVNADRKLRIRNPDEPILSIDEGALGP